MFASLSRNTQDDLSGLDFADVMGEELPPDPEDEDDGVKI